MQIKVWFNNDKSVDIELFQNAAVTKWFTYYKKFSESDFYNAIAVDQAIQHKSWDAVTIENHWQAILDTFDQLRDLGFKLPWSVPQEFDGKQSTLNNLHRFFTYNSMWFTDCKNLPGPWDANFKPGQKIANPFDPDFILSKDVDYESWLKLIDPINRAVHGLENYAELTSNKQFVCEQLPLPGIHVMQSSILQRGDFAAETNSWMLFTEEEQQVNYSYFDYDLPLVILDQSILGKCVMQSFVEDDDFTARDCTGRLGSYGGFWIDLTDNRKKIYQSDVFDHWLAKHFFVWGIPFEFPIGHVKNYPDVLQWINADLKFKKIEFVD
jgi:hypothetical protein